MTQSAFVRTLRAVKRTILPMLLLAIAACPSEPKAPPPPPLLPAALAAPPERGAQPEGGMLTLGPLMLKVPPGFGIVQQTPNTVLLRHITDLTVTIGLSGKSEPEKDEKTIVAFLAQAQTELKKLAEARVSAETRTLPDSSRVIRGVVAHTVDRKGTPVNERREMWVISEGPAIITASFIFIEDAEGSAAAVDYVLRMLRDAIDALDALRQQAK